MKLRNKLLCYRGGGYDGCCWEWNFGYFDNEAKFHSIYASGYAGIHEEDKAYAEASEIRREMAECRRTNQACDVNSGDLLDLNLCSSMVALDRRYVWDFVRICLIELEASGLLGKKAQLNLHAFCDKCGREVHACDIEDEMHGVDVISATGRCSGPFFHSSKVCNDCYGLGCCRACLEIGNSDPYDDDLYEGGYCWFHQCYMLLDLLHDGELERCEDTEELLDLFKSLPKHDRETYKFSVHHDLLEKTWNSLGKSVEGARKRKPSAEEKAKQPVLPGIEKL